MKRWLKWIGIGLAIVVVVIAAHRDVAARGRIRRTLRAGAREVCAANKLSDRKCARRAGQSADARKRALSRSAIRTRRPHKKCKSGICAVRPVLAHAARSNLDVSGVDVALTTVPATGPQAPAPSMQILADAAAVDPARSRQHRLDQDRAGRPAGLRRRFARSRRDVDSRRVAVAETGLARAGWKARPERRRHFVFGSARQRRKARSTGKSSPISAPPDRSTSTTTARTHSSSCSSRSRRRCRSTAPSPRATARIRGRRRCTCRSSTRATSSPTTRCRAWRST